MSSTALPDDVALMKQIIETHNPDGKIINYDPLMRIVEGILYHATPLGIQEAMQEKSKLTDVDNAMLEDLPNVLTRISSEMAYKCSANSDAHSTAISLLKNLSTFPWDGKLALLLAAFVLNYGEFWLVQIHASSKLARRIAVLKQAPKLEIQKKQLGGFNGLIKSILDLAKCVLLFNELPPESSDLPEVSTACGSIPPAIYWATRGVIMCATHTNQFIALDHDYAKKLSGILENDVPALAEKIGSSNESLKKQLDLCYQSIEKQKENEAYKLLLEQFEAVHTDNIKPLRLLINGSEDQPQLIEGSTKKTINLEDLKRKHVLLLISAPCYVSSDEIFILEQIYMETKAMSGLRDDFEIVWIPTVEYHQTWTVTPQKYENYLAAIPWYSLMDPNLISKPVKRLFRERFHYKNLPILVVLDNEGRVLNLNAFDMMWVWGSSAFPFTNLREETLWREQSWNLELIVDGIDPHIVEWMGSGKYVILYGGDDMQWINKFTATARQVAHAAAIPLEMVYVGKGGKSEQEKGAIVDTINKSQLSRCWEEVMIWFFWTRLRSILFSKTHLTSYNEHDPVVQGTKKLLMYDGAGPWAMFCRGPNVGFTGPGPVVLQALERFDAWKEKMDGVDFLDVLEEQCDRKGESNHPCYHLELQAGAGIIPENMVCTECDRYMEQSAVYSCCHDHD